jgi:predicted ATPase
MTSSPSQEALAQMWSSRVFEPQIHHLRFPRFRNLQDGLRIEFQHPITALVGPNGTNKSSILRALQGCPDKENIGRYWFGTAIDVMSADERHRFIHGRWSDSANQVVEVRKTRIQRRAANSKSDPDYFEPSRPNTADGMSPMPDAPKPMPTDRTETRWTAIEKDVVYLDFRAEISAFDKYFYHHDYRQRRLDEGRSRDGLASRKALIRERSARLKRILDDRLDSYQPGGFQWVLAPARDMTSAETDAVSKILGRTYSRIELVSHRAFNVSGTTARLHTADFSYSEAWAGSGEFAAVQLVAAVSAAPAKALVLLDEPEVSLHPGAQRRLLEYIVGQVKARKLQVVLATHSPVLVEDLPPPAIKVLELDPTTNRIRLRSQASSAAEAFVAIEHHFQKRTVFVEDLLAKQIVLKALRGAGSLKLNAVDVRALPGGAGDARARRAPGWAAENRNDVLLMLDGDQRLAPNMFEPENVTPGDLEGVVKELLGVATLGGFVLADSGGPTVEQLREIVVWASKYMRFLPGSSTPEAWLINASAETSDVCDAKQWWIDRTAKSLQKIEGEQVTGVEILEEQKRAIALVPDDHDDLKAIRTAITEFLGRP